MRIGEKLLSKAVLEVPLAQFSICSRRAETQWEEDGPPNANGLSEEEYSATTSFRGWMCVFICVLAYVPENYVEAIFYIGLLRQYVHVCE